MRGFGACLGFAETSRCGKSGTSDDEKRAISYPNIAKQFQKTNPAKTREYFEKAIKAAPDSSAATEAAKLLKGLPSGDSK